MAKKHGSRPGEGSRSPIAVRSTNMDEAPEPVKSRRKALYNSPFQREQRVASFKRNREVKMRNLMKDSK